MYPPIAGVSRETHDVLASFADMLLQWNSTHNLISKKSEADIWLRHIEDSVQIYELAPDSTKSWLDLGSGAGLPGIVAAILARGAGRSIDFTLVEANRKKATFLRAASRAFHLGLNVENSRIESVVARPYDVISARALASLDQLLVYADRFRSERTICLLPKGRTVEKELNEARKNWKIRSQAIPSRTDESSVILRIQEYEHVHAPRRDV
jgi:16S rRNA (guanine527-N7)-methyltransferase